MRISYRWDLFFCIWEDLLHTSEIRGDTTELKITCQVLSLAVIIPDSSKNKSKNHTLSYQLERGEYHRRSASKYCASKWRLCHLTAPMHRHCWPNSHSWLSNVRQWIQMDSISCLLKQVQPSDTLIEAFTTLDGNNCDGVIPSDGWVHLQLWEMGEEPVLSLAGYGGCARAIAAFGISLSKWLCLICQ